MTGTAPPDWLAAVRRYLAAVAVGSIAVLHCTAGDVVIAAASLVAAPVFLGARDWPRRRFAPVAAAALAVGLG